MYHISTSYYATVFNYPLIWLYAMLWRFLERSIQAFKTLKSAICKLSAILQDFYSIIGHLKGVSKLLLDEAFPLKLSLIYPTFLPLLFCLYTTKSLFFFNDSSYMAYYARNRIKWGRIKRVLLNVFIILIVLPFSISRLKFGHRHLKHVFHLYINWLNKKYCRFALKKLIENL